VSKRVGYRVLYVQYWMGDGSDEMRWVLRRRPCPPVIDINDSSGTEHGSFSVPRRCDVASFTVNSLTLQSHPRRGVTSRHAGDAVRPAPS